MNKKDNNYIHKLKIGDIELKNNVFLAPMAGVTDLSFRYIVNKHNPGLMCTEMVSAKALMYEDIKTNKMLELLPDERPSSVQIFGGDKEAIKLAIEKLCKNDAIDIIDINMGCPAQKVTKNQEGSALLKDLSKVEEVIKVACETSTKPITIKTRTGYYNNMETAVQVAKIAEKYGCKMITLHARTKQQMYTGIADLDVIKRVKEAVAIPVIGNGDVIDLESANKMFEYTGCDGIMIGRGSMGNPWIFDEIIGQKKVKVTHQEKLVTILEHIDKALEKDDAQKIAYTFRKHVSWYLKGLPESSKVKDEINRQSDIEKVKELLIAYFKTI